MTREETIWQCYSVPGQTWPVELGWLYDTIRHSKSHCEVGVWAGRSLLASCSAMYRGSSVIAVDDCGGWHGLSHSWMETVQQATIDLLPKTITVTKIRMNSIDASRECIRKGLRFDSVFIDACHEYAECKADIHTWMALVKPGGLVCGHDYWPANIGVMDAVNEVFEGKHDVVPGTRIWFTRKA